MKKPDIFIVFGPPCSGLSLMQSCMGLFGFQTDSVRSPLNADLINSLLIQDLGHGVSASGPLPRGWMSSSGAQKAQERINKLLHDIATSDQPLLLADSRLCLTSTLWGLCLEKAGLSPEFIFMLRHPWEVAMALKEKMNIDLNTAHICWLSYVRGALNFLKDHDHTLITFDQLLADPVSTCNAFLLISPDNRLTSEKIPQKFSKGVHPDSLGSDLFDLVQPNLKTHQASNLSVADRETFTPYAKLYDQLRAARHALPGQISENQWIKNHDSSEIDLIDTLLQALSQTPSRIRDSDYPTTIGDSSKITNNFSQLSAYVTFPSSKKESGFTHAIPLIETTKCYWHQYHFWNKDSKSNYR